MMTVFSNEFILHYVALAIYTRIPAACEALKSFDIRITVAIKIPTSVVH